MISGVNHNKKADDIASRMKAKMIYLIFLIKKYSLNHKHIRYIAKGS